MNSDYRHWSHGPRTRPGRSGRPRTWYVYCGGPLDRFTDASLPVSAVLEADEPWWTSRPDRNGQAREEFPQAIAAVEQHAAWQGEMRDEPYIIYVPSEDAHCYIFKLSGGPVFVVSPFSQPQLRSTGWDETKVVVASTAVRRRS